MSTHPSFRLALLLICLGKHTFAQQPAENSPWYVTASGGYSTGWNAKKRFVFASSTPIGPALDPLAQRVKPSSRGIGSLAVGRHFGKNRDFSLRVEGEGIYQPQTFEITTFSYPAFPVSPLPGSTPPGLVFATKEDEYGMLANVGLAAAWSQFHGSVMIGFGRNLSSAARTTNLGQVKAGVSWDLGDSLALVLDARYLKVWDYSIESAEFGPFAVLVPGQRYDFGSRHSVSGTLGLRVRF